MRHIEIIEKLIWKAHGTTFPHEQASFLAKAQALMGKHGIGYADLSPRIAGYYDELCGGSSQQAKQKSSSPPPKPPKPGVTTVNQSGLKREVPDKEWHHLQCQHCGNWFTYESYPGNPRRYCSPKCKQEHTRYEARWRMWQRRHQP